MAKKGDIINSEFQKSLEEAVLNYQSISKTGSKIDIDTAYKKITGLYNPLDFSNAWYDQYKYLFDSKEDFESDYLRVFITVLLGWKPRSLRKNQDMMGAESLKIILLGRFIIIISI